MKMYVLVRNDLDIAYRFVQGSHAISQYCLDNEILFKDWGNGTLVFLSVEDEQELEKWCYKLKNKTFSKFYEPDINNQLTAISCLDDGKIFSKLKLA